MSTETDAASALASSQSAAASADSAAESLTEAVIRFAALNEGTLAGAAASAETAAASASSAASSAELAEDISNISTSDDVITVIDNNASSTFRVQQDARLFTGRNAVVIEAGKYASLQAACDAAATRGSGSLNVGVKVLLPDGTTTLTSTLLIKQQALVVEGRGPGSILKWGGAAGLPMVNVQDSSRAMFSDMTILGDATNPPSDGIYAEAPTTPIVGTNENIWLKRISFGRKFSTDTADGAPMQHAFRVGGAADGNNDQFVVEDCSIHDATVAGIKIANTQSIWGHLRNVFFNSCAIGLSTNANLETENLTFNRCDIDVELTQGRLNINGFYSEHSGLLWSQAAACSLSIRGGKALVNTTDLTDSTKWASSAVTAGNVLSIRDFLVTRQSGTSVLKIAGSSSNTVPSQVYIRSSTLPDGDSDAGYVIDGYAAGTPLLVDIQQGTYWRRQVVQSLAAVGGFLPNPSRQLLGPWWRDNVAASLTNDNITDGQPTHTGILMVRSGNLTGISARVNIARTAGTLTIRAHKNGSVFGTAVVIDGTNTSTISGLMAFGTASFVAGDRIGVQITTSADWAPITSDLTVSLEISS